jgi:hypothetical protein
MRSSATHLIAVMLAWVVALGGYSVWYGVISKKSNEVVDLENKIIQTSDAMGRIASTRVALTEISRDEAQVQGYFVPETGASALIEDLEARGAAQRANVSVLSAAIGGTPAQPTLTLPITVTGTFDAVMRTVGAIEYAPYAISVSGVSVQKNANSAWQASLTLTIWSTPRVTSNTP